MKYKVVVGTLFVGRKKYKRGDIIETDEDYGTRVEPYIEFVPEAPKPKRKRKTKAQIEAEKEILSRGPDED